jgi:hypothetical protein
MLWHVDPLLGKLVSRKLQQLRSEQFGNSEERERPPLEAVTRRLVKTQQAEKT